jgi:hypothetical protein
MLLSSIPVHEWYDDAPAPSRALFAFAPCNTSKLTRLQFSQNTPLVFLLARVYRGIALDEKSLQGKGMMNPPGK